MYCPSVFSCILRGSWLITNSWQELSVDCSSYYEAARRFGYFEIYLNLVLKYDHAVNEILNEPFAVLYIS